MQVYFIVNVGLMLQFLGSNALNTPTNTSNKHAFYGVKGEHCSAISVTDKLPLCDQVPKLSPQRLIPHWIGQVGEAKSLRVLEA